MSFNKTVPFEIAEYKVYDVGSEDELVKVASDDISFPDGFEYDPDFLYLWVRIVSAGEFFGPNKNGDFFPENELIEWFETFREAHPFKNHENKKVENAIGVIVSARWNPVMKCVEVLKGIDKKQAPEVVRGYLKGYLTDVSMGCKVPYTVCSVCGNKATKRSEFCQHVNKHRLQMLGNGERVYEINYKPKFHDSSTVLNGAERVAKAFFIIDKPNPENYVVPSFRKASSDGYVNHFIPYSEQELDKIASFEENAHPLLREPDFKKTASQSDLMRKIAELQKDLTGKLLNIATIPEEDELDVNQKVLETVKFLTEKRFDEDSLESMGETIKEVAKESGVSVKQALCTFMGVAELLGIEFFPGEIHKIMRKISNVDLHDSFALSEYPETEVYPNEYLSSMDDIAPVYHEATKGPFDIGTLYDLFNNAPLDDEDFIADPVTYAQRFKAEPEEDFEPSKHMVQTFERLFEPTLPMRSQMAEHLYPRLSIIVSGDRPILGSGDSSRDLNMMTRPESMGDLLTALSYAIYEQERPKMMSRRIVKVAADHIGELEKIAVPVNNVNPQDIQSGRVAAPTAAKGLKNRHLLMGAVPLAYGASKLQENRREHGRFLSDGENFVADHPLWTAAGLAVGGKLAHKGGQKAMQSAKRVGPKAKQLGGQATNAVKGVGDKAKNLFSKTSSIDEGMEFLKEAKAFSSGEYNLFEDEAFHEKYASSMNVDPEMIEAVKLAATFACSGMDKEAEETKRFYGIPDTEVVHFLKRAEEHLHEEIEKAASDYLSNLSLSMVADRSPLGQTLPGRAVDAMIFSKIFPSNKEDEEDGPDIENPKGYEGPKGGLA